MKVNSGQILKDYKCQKMWETVLCCPRGISQDNEMRLRKSKYMPHCKRRAVSQVQLDCRMASMGKWKGRKLKTNQTKCLRSKLEIASHMKGLLLSASGKG